ncbi:MAG: hypothetical protein AAB401_15620 [Acidobacteriota bacterium]
MSGKGYIFFWRNLDGKGRIRACQGSFAGLEPPFTLSDCDASLQLELALINIQQSKQCPPPPNSLRVQFDFGVSNGQLVAINVSKIA